VKKDPSVIEKEEMDKIGKVWVNIVRRDIPRHHRAFTNLHKKQLTDAKRFSDFCQREVCIVYLTFSIGHDDTNSFFPRSSCFSAKFVFKLRLI